DTTVVVEEAYVDFGGTSSVSLLEKYDNLMIIQTMSKSRALAGLRVGYALASADIIQALERVKDSFNSYPMDTIAQVGAVASLKDTE
ncbi:aminotransferase class I/II-fold pyridoxal phosphate-dependent enzyme, partial [Salmonella enterica]|uniref:aminotransferase class I/II-fold pyridoxal phosphate-dependent enzyme n=1 Tax=Salmonella enterica TaxID=28901 RepID=UPI003CE83357